ncbi:Protein of unknown function, partial [Gryllus bimaculatus]
NTSDSGWSSDDSQTFIYGEEQTYQRKKNRNYENVELITLEKIYMKGHVTISLKFDKYFCHSFKFLHKNSHHIMDYLHQGLPNFQYTFNLIVKIKN